MWVGCGILKYFVVRGELSFVFHEKKTTAVHDKTNELVFLCCRYNKLCLRGLQVGLILFS